MTRREATMSSKSLSVYDLIISVDSFVWLDCKLLLDYYNVETRDVIMERMMSAMMMGTMAVSK